MEKFSHPKGTHERILNHEDYFSIGEKVLEADPENQLDAHMWFLIAEFLGSNEASLAKVKIEELMSFAEISESKKNARSYCLKNWG